MVCKSQEPYILTIRKINGDSNNKYLNTKKNNTKKNTFSPLSGSELEYNPKLWNANYSIKNSHNCYSYALGKIVKELDYKAQPGYASGFEHISNNDFTCGSFKKRLIKDSPGSYTESFDNKCLPGFYKIFLALDIAEDYHWWQQNKNGYWSHKPGSTDVINIDASGDKIINPVKSNRNFSHRNYKTPCFYACIYSDLSRSLDSIYNIN